jgi:hypothetical protein
LLINAIFSKEYRTNIDHLEDEVFQKLKILKFDFENGILEVNITALVAVINVCLALRIELIL